MGQFGGNMQKTLITLLFLSACGGDATPDPPPPVAQLTATLHWTWVESSATCKTAPTCNGACEAEGGCDCQVCANPPCQPATQTLHCCNKTLQVPATRKSSLATTYSRCSITEPSAGLLDIECDDGNMPVYLINAWDTVHTGGTTYAYTDDITCVWDLPY
jgi:hypothetical protein